MSLVKLGSINTSYKASNPDYYISSIVRSDSGFMNPYLVRSIEELDSFFGEFPYSEMYKGFIQNGIPCLLTPIITNLSQYNRCSLRLNKAIIEYCHPKFGKRYKYRSLGSILEWNFGVDVPVTEFEFEHNLGFYPVVTVVVNNENVLNRIQYVSEDKIKLYFSEPVEGYVSIESIDYINSNIKDFTFSGNSYVLDLEDDIMPEIILLDKQGFLLESSMKLIGNRLQILTNETQELIDCHVRLIPKYFTGNIRTNAPSQRIIHNLNHYPNFIITNMEDGFGADIRVQYVDRNSVDIVNQSQADINITYNLINNDNSIDINSIYNGQYSFCHTLDFTNVTHNDFILSSSFFIIELNKANHLFWFNNSNGGNPPQGVYQSYWDPGCGHLILKESKEEIIKEIKSILSKILGPNKCTDINDRVLSFCKDYFNSKPLIFDEDYVDLNESDKEFHDNEFKRYVDNLILEVYKTDFWIMYQEDLSSVINTTMYSIYNNNPDISGNIYDEFEIEWSKSDIQNQLNLDKLFLEYFIPTFNLNFYSLPNFKIYDEINYNDDVLCDLTEKEKIIEFYSKIKGSKGKDININIEKIPRTQYKYQIIISLGEYKEIFLVNTANQNIDASLDFDVEDESYIRVNQISQYSKLVDAYLFDYILEDGTLCPQFEFELYKSENEVYDYSRELPAVELPEGTWNLDRLNTEVWRYDDIINTLKSIEDSDYYPDLFIVNELDYGKNNVEFCKVISDFCNSKLTQALVRVDETHVYTNPEMSMEDKQSRVLYFYKDLILNKEIFNSCYPLAINIIDSNFLKIVSEKIIYKIEGYTKNDPINGQLIDKELLSDLNINYLDYNNLYYSYATFREKKLEPNFIIRFIISKVSRGFLENQGTLINCEQSKFAIKVNEIIEKLKSLLPLIKTLTYNYQIESDKYNITLSVEIYSIVNKIFTFNLTLNI